MLRKYSSTAHLQKAEHNMQFRDDLDLLERSNQDWQVVASFYAALHLLQAYFTAKTSYYPTLHSDRDTLVGKLPALVGIWNQYRELKTLSTAARYGCGPINDFDVTESRELVDEIRNHIDQLLSTQ